MSAKPPRTPLPWTRGTILWLTLADDIDFAVRAANSHDDLLTALKDIIAARDNYHGGDLKRAIDASRSIVAKAEEK